MKEYIEPRVLKGFRDFLPQAEIVRRNLTENIENTFRSFGFVPIDTPALEYSEILLGKGGGETEKQIYRFKDNGDRDVALRFDLTVPFARYVALHKAELAFPFKRYHIGKVWRGENTQRGRYREFTQCDFDIIGSDSPAADFEIILMIYSILNNLGTGHISIKINHRGLFNRFLLHIGQRENSVEILRAVDKLAKTGLEETNKNLCEISGESAAGLILDFIGAGKKNETESFEETLERIISLSGGPSPESDRLMAIKNYMNDAGNDCSFYLDPSITRGLDYYTGIVFETFLNDLPDIGSICSGGRYDNLAGLYTKNNISGVGSSIGLDRMIAALESLQRLPAGSDLSSAAVVCLKPEDSGLYQKYASFLRNAGINCEVFSDAAESTDPKHLVKQFVLAEKKGIHWMIIPGENNDKNQFTLRDLKSRQNTNSLSLNDIVNIINK